MDQATESDNGYNLNKVVSYSSPRCYASAELLNHKRLNTQLIVLVIHKQLSDKNGCRLTDNAPSLQFNYTVTPGAMLQTNNEMQLEAVFILLYCQVTLHVSGVFRTHYQEYRNCSYNHWYTS
jgi:hypothetical protein